MHRLTALSIVTTLGIFGINRPVEGRELVLNYLDPHGAVLLLAVVPNVGGLPNWLKEPSAKAAEKEFSKFALSPSANSGIGEKLARYVLEFPSTAADEVTRVPPVEVGPEHGPRIEIEPTVDLGLVPECGTDALPHDQCRMSSLANEVLSTALQQSHNTVNDFDSLLASKNLMMDDRAAKRVLVTVDDRDVVEYTDFVGLVRGRDESLPAPDAVSVFVIRMNAAGGFSVVERHSDAVDLNSIKFEFESTP